MTDQEKIDRAMATYLRDKFDLYQGPDNKFYILDQFDEGQDEPRSGENPKFNSVEEFFKHNQDQAQEFQKVMSESARKHGITFEDYPQSRVTPSPIPADNLTPIWNQDGTYNESQGNQDSTRLMALSPETPEIFNAVSDKIRNRMKALQ